MKKKNQGDMKNISGCKPFFLLLKGHNNNETAH